MQKEPLESSNEACARLNISAQTLYAYVSRGLIHVAPHPGDSRKRLYSSIDIDLLINRQNRGRSRQDIARSTIDFGEPVLRSKISSIHDGQFYYRGDNATHLSKKANLENIFEQLCNTTITDSMRAPKVRYISKQHKPFARFVDALTYYVIHDKSQGNKKYAYQLLRLMACNATQQFEIFPGEPIHEQLARCWSTDPRAPDLIRRALVLSADHELNASTYATRVTASAGANLSACLLVGVSTLSGDKHGGLTNLCSAWMTDVSARKTSQIELSAKALPPGFGHRLYPQGDPRATEILEHCPAPVAWTRVAKKVIKVTAAYPTLDFGLATLEHQLKLPKGAGFSIFAVGRTVGWLAHCFEQRKYGALIRPRALAHQNTEQNDNLKIS